MKKKEIIQKLGKLGFQHDIIHDEYFLNAHQNITRNLPLDHHVANTPEELAGFSKDSKVHFLKDGKRVGKQNWKQIRFVFDHDQKAWLDIYTYHGYMLRITQDRCEIHYMQIPDINEGLIPIILKLG